MALRLTIENETSLPDGGPLSVVVSGTRGLDIGRDSHLDWTLPDPSRAISSKHCEVRFENGGYVLHDVSTNGTFLNGAAGRLKGPHQLRNGDRLVIGHYVVVVAIDGEAPPSIETHIVKPAAYENLWDSDGDAAAPVAASQIMPPAERPKPVRADFLDWAADVPVVSAGLMQDPVVPGPPAVADDMDWARATPRPPPLPPQETPIPSPRRSSWISNEPNGPWGSGPGEPQSAPVEKVPVADTSVVASATPSSATPSSSWISNEPNVPWGSGPGEPQSAPVEKVPVADTSVAASATPSSSWISNEPNVPWSSGPGEPRQSAPVEKMPVAAASAVASATPASYGGQGSAHFAREVARGAGLPDDFFASRDCEKLARELGVVMRIVAENVHQLLVARLQAKRHARSANQTMVQATENNPLKFAPSTDEAMRIMFGPPTRSYLDASRALQQGFEDLKSHQIRTYKAMQQALVMLIEGFDPKSVELATGSGLLSSRKSRMWDLYADRWKQKASSLEGGMLDVFMNYFAECYDREDDKR